MKMLAPIVVFVYNREDHIKRLIESLEINELANDSSLFIFSDGYKGNGDMNQVLAVRKFINTIAERGSFKEVNIIEAQKNKGLANSIITGVSQIIHEYGKVIVLEDDLIVSPHFLSFMNQALDYYENEKRVWSVSGFSRDIEYLHHVDIDMYFSVRAQSWSWGTWVDRWDKMDWAVKDYKNFKWNFKARRGFNEGGNDMASMLDRQQCGRINSWAIRFCYGQYKNEAMTVQPKETLVQNGGQDGSGTNCNYVREFSDISKKDYWNFREVKEDKDINKALKKTRKHIPRWKLIGSFCAFVLLKGKFN